MSIKYHHISEYVRVHAFETTNIDKMDQHGTSIGQSLNMKSHPPFTTGSFLAPVRLSSGAAAFAWQNLGRWGGSKLA